MAKKVQTLVEYTDDLDGSKAEGTVSFAFDGASYEIDLSRKNTAAFTKALKPYVEAARKVRGTRSAARPARATNNKERLQSIRAWARDNGYEVSDRGRIPSAVIEAFNAK